MWRLTYRGRGGYKVSNADAQAIAKLVDYVRFLRDATDELENSIGLQDWFSAFLTMGGIQDMATEQFQGFFGYCKELKFKPNPADSPEGERQVPWWKDGESIEEEEPSQEEEAPDNVVSLHRADCPHDKIHWDGADSVHCQECDKYLGTLEEYESEHGYIDEEED